MSLRTTAILALALLCVQGPAHARSATETITAMAHEVVNATSSHDIMEKDYLSAGLKRFNNHIDQNHWRNFDGDMLTGAQDLSGLKVGSVTDDSVGDLSTVSVVYIVEGQKTIVYYVMTKERHEWKIDDIVYSSPIRSFRYLMTKPLN